MNIYIIEKEENRDNLETYLKGLGKVIFLYKDTKDINAYTEIIEDKEDKIIAFAPGLLGWSIPIDFLKKVTNLRGLVTKSSWALFIDKEYCTENYIQIRNSPGANNQSVAEYAIWQMSSLMKLLPLQLSNNFKVEIKKSTEGEELKGKTVGILGMGKIAQIIADIAFGMGMNVKYWNRRIKDNPYQYIPSIEELLSSVDVVFKTWETSEETKPLLTSTNLKLLKPSTYFVSIFGGIGWSGEDDYILLDMAEKGQIAGFSIESEHHKDAKVKPHYEGNVFIPAALAWHTTQTHARYNKILADGIVDIVNSFGKIR